MTHEDWLAYRHQSVTASQGDLALVARHEIREACRIDGLPGIWAPADPDRPGLVLRASASEGIEIDGRLVDGDVRLEADVTIARLSDTVTLTATWQPGSNHLLAVWDSTSQGIRTFSHIDTYPYDPNWVLTGRFEPDDFGKMYAFTHTADTGGRMRLHRSPGVIAFTYEGTTYGLRPFETDGGLIIVFRDGTSGTETYGMGRMLLVKPAEDGSAMLDFNRAFLPPCAFSPHFNCPMPPASNRLPFAIRAGERHVVFRSNPS